MCIFCLFDDEDASVVIISSVATDEDHFVSKSKSPKLDISAILNTIFFFLLGIDLSIALSYLEFLFHFLIFSLLFLELFLFFGFFYVFVFLVENVSWMMHWALRNIVLFGDIFLLLFFFNLIYILFDIGSHHEQIIDKFYIIAP